jgi:phage gp29-like protein
MAKGLWIDKNTFVSFADKKISLSEELATRKRSIDFYGLGMYLPNPDPVLKKQGKDITIYHELLSDSHIGACETSRKTGVQSLEWEIDRGKAKSRQANEIKKIFDDLDIDGIVSEMLNAPLYGYQVLEVLWKKGNKFLYPEKVVGKPQEWFVFSEENELLFRTKDNWNGESLPERKFLLARHKANYKNPYGFPELSRCFWPVTFKRGGLKFWVMFTEKYGMPFLIGKHPRGTPPEENDKLADMLERMVQDAIAVIPDDSSVEIKEAGGKSASADIYEKLLHFCNAEISKALLGQTLTTEIGETGGAYAASQTHMEVRKDIIGSDKKMCVKVFNKLISWIFELNFSSGEMPKFGMWEEEDVDKTLAERDETLTKAGVKFTKKYWQKSYGFDDEDFDVGAIRESTAPAKEFAEKDTKPALDVMIDRLNKEANFDEIWKPVEKLINEASSLEELRDKLIDMYSEMDVTELGNLLQRAFTAADLSGRFEVMK